MTTVANNQKVYNKDEVRGFIKKQRDIYESILVEQKERIANLKSRVYNLQQQLEGMKRNEKELCDAFVCAIEQNNLVKKAQDSIYELELQRVRDLYENYRQLFEDKMNQIAQINAGLIEGSENARLLGVGGDENYNILDEISKDVALEQAFSGFDFYEELKQEEREKQEKKNAKKAKAKTENKTETKTKTKKAAS